MVTIREVIYETEENADTIFSRLDWAVEEVNNLFGQLTQSNTADTNRPWVGVVNKQKKTFGLLEPRGFFNVNFAPIIVRGKVIDGGETNEIEIKYKLSLYATILISLVYSFGIFAILISIVDRVFSIEAFLWLAIFPGIGTYLLIRNLNKTEEKIEFLFNVE